MSMYQLACGVNPAAGLLLQLIGIDYYTIPRFRDVYLLNDERHVVVYTRTGGGNREEYEAPNEALCKNLNYVSDWDDDFDSTYAHFKFKITDEGIKFLKESMSELDPKEKQIAFEVMSTTPKSKFENAMRNLK